MAENGDLLEAAYEKLNLGRLQDSLQYAAQLQQNLIYLATHADEEPDLQPITFVPQHARAAARARRETTPTWMGTFKAFRVELPVGSCRAPLRRDGSQDLDEKM